MPFNFHLQHTHTHKIPSAKVRGPIGRWPRNHSVNQICSIWVLLLITLYSTSEITEGQDPMGSPSRGADVAVYVCDINQPSLPTPCYSVLFCVCFCLYDPFNCIWFHKFSHQLSALSLCSSGIISALLVLSTLSLSLSLSLHETLRQPWYNPLWLTGLKAPTN